MYLVSHMVIIDFCIVSPTPLQIKLWDVGLMLVHRLRRWSNIKALSGRRRVLAGLDKWVISQSFAVNLLCTLPQALSTETV